LNQVFLNILINAKQAIEGKGHITIATSSDSGFIRVQITDDGPGMSEDTLRRIFDPGFTTKGVGVGTGLGLSICYQIIQDHRGTIDVSSEPGKGTTFTISIPTNLDESMFPRNYPS
ncbi:MAG: histidine kinase, partial [candidate division Zixibacteria bacterium]|nr:histidine kinase [candidate division Zixibacteria bacterium]